MRDIKITISVTSNTWQALLTRVLFSSYPQFYSVEILSVLEPQVEST